VGSSVRHMANRECSSSLGRKEKASLKAALQAFQSRSRICVGRSWPSPKRIRTCSAPGSRYGRHREGGQAARKELGGQYDGMEDSASLRNGWSRYRTPANGGAGPRGSLRASSLHPGTSSPLQRNWMNFPSPNRDFDESRCPCSGREGKTACRGSSCGSEGSRSRH